MVDKPETTSLNGVNQFIAITPDQLKELISAAIGSKSGSGSNIRTRNEQSITVPMDSGAEKYFSKMIRRHLYQVNFVEFKTFEEIRLYYELKHRKMKKSFRNKMGRTKIFWDLTNPEKQYILMYQIRKFVLNSLYKYKSIIVWNLTDEFVGWYPQFQHLDIRRKIGDFCRSLVRFGLIKCTQVRDTKKKRSTTYKCRIFLLKDAPEDIVQQSEDDYMEYQHGFLEYKPNREEIVEERKVSKKINAQVEHALYHDPEFTSILEETEQKKKSIKKKINTNQKRCVNCSGVAFFLYVPDQTLYCPEHHNDIAGKTIPNIYGKYIHYRVGDFIKIKAS